MNRSIIKYVASRFQQGAHALDIQYELLSSGYSKDQIDLILAEALVAEEEILPGKLTQKETFSILGRSIPELLKFLFFRTLFPQLVLTVIFAIIFSTEQKSINHNYLTVAYLTSFGFFLTQFILFIFIRIICYGRFNYYGCLLENRKLLLYSTGIYIFALVPLFISTLYFGNIYFSFVTTTLLLVCSMGILSIHKITLAIDLIAVTFRYFRFKFRDILVGVASPIIIFLLLSYISSDLIKNKYLNFGILVLLFSILIISIVSSAFTLLHNRMQAPKSWKGYKTLAILFLVITYCLAAWALCRLEYSDWNLANSLQDLFNEGIYAVSQILAHK